MLNIELNIELIREDDSLEVPEVRVSVGWPSRGALSARNRTIGQYEYLKALREEGCTYTDADPRNDPDMPAFVYHDGDTCPVHER